VAGALKITWYGTEIESNQAQAADKRASMNLRLRLIGFSYQGDNKMHS